MLIAFCSLVPEAYRVPMETTELLTIWVEEIAQRLKALTALPEVLSSIPSNHMGWLTTI